MILITNFEIKHGKVRKIEKIWFPPCCVIIWPWNSSNNLSQKTDCWVPHDNKTTNDQAKLEHKLQKVHMPSPQFKPSHYRKSKHGRIVDVRKPKSFIKAGFVPSHETALLIHGFNGTQTSQHIMYLKEGDVCIETVFDQRLFKISLLLQRICHDSSTSLQVCNSGYNCKWN